MKERAKEMKTPARNQMFELHLLLESIAECLLHNLDLCESLESSDFYSYFYNDFVERKVVVMGPDNCHSIALFSKIGNKKHP